MIIKCPSCNSEFAVDNEIIRKAKSPTFHCNICNLFFRVEKEDLLIQSSEDDKKVQISEEGQIISYDNYFNNEESFGKQAFDTIKPLLRIGKNGIFNIGKIKNKQSQNLSEAQETLDNEFREAIEENQPVEPIKKQDATTIGNDVEKNISNTTSDDIAAAVFALSANDAAENKCADDKNEIPTTTNVWKWDNKKKAASSAIHGKKVKQYIDDINFNSTEESVFIDDYISKSGNKALIKKTAASFRRHLVTSKNNIKNKTFDITKNSAKIANDILCFSFKLGKNAENAIKHIPLKIVIFLLVPYVVFASICYGALNLNSAPNKLIATIIDINKKNLPEVAPTSLEILNIEQKEVETSDNKKIINISGEIFNTDTYSFQNISLELTTYDKHNRLLKSKFISLNNKLAVEFFEEARNNPNIRFESLLSVLSLDDIIARQSSISSKTNIKLRPNYRTTFNFALTDITNKIAYFSVKVYTVKKTDNS